ncbi:MAG: SHOCT domain-containing protein [Liquorilactobacillus nagelii]|uniref:SHOCT domain-containing protein n=1 Tax=Liquorilactobacillus satsumensis TaxID=259059 RepID=UPI0039EC697F
MKIENKIIVRRLIAGILLILMSIYCIYESNQLNRVGSTNLSTSAGAGYVIGAYSFIVGVIFIATCKTRPVEWFEYTIVGIGVILLIAVTVSAPQKYFVDLKFFSLGLIIFMALGLPFKNGFNGMPFTSKIENDDSENAKDINSSKRYISDDSAKLRELKQLLDDGIITQAEFDAKKKQILGI